MTDAATSDEWREVTLGEIFEISSSKRVLQEQWKTSGVPFYRAREIVKLAKNGVVENELFISEELFDEYRKKYGVPAPGDLMVSAVGTLGACYVVQPKDRFYYKDASVLQFSPKKPVNSKFIQYAFGTNEILDQVNGGSGSTVGTFTIERANKTRLTLPPLAEQRRITDVLDRTEALRANRRAALAQLDSLTQSLFVDLFGDPRLNERKWPLQAIGTFIFDMRGGAALQPDDFVDSGFPILHKGAIKAQGLIGIDAKKKTFTSLAYAESCPNNIVNRDFVAVTLRDLVPSGPSIGLTANLRSGPFDEYLLAQGAYGFRVDESMAAPEFLVHLSNNKNFRHVLKQNSVGSTQIHIRTPVYLAIQIPLPPIELQREFARRVTAAEKLKMVQRVSLAELEALFATLQNRAFKGEL